MIKKVLLTLLLLPSVLTAGMVLPLELGRIVQEAGRIFVGVCKEASPELDEYGLPAVWIRYKVLKAVKGVEAGQEVLVKRFGGHGTSTCPQGEERLLFLYPDSRLGFTSPVALGQGEMLIQMGADGKKRVVSPFPHLSRELGDIGLDEFLGELRGLIRHDQHDQ